MVELQKSTQLTLNRTSSIFPENLEECVACCLLFTFMPLLKKNPVYLRIDYRLETYVLLSWNTYWKAARPDPRLRSMKSACRALVWHGIPTQEPGKATTKTQKKHKWDKQRANCLCWNLWRRTRKSAAAVEKIERDSNSLEGTPEMVRLHGRVSSATYTGKCTKKKKKNTALACMSSKASRNHDGGGLVGAEGCSVWFCRECAISIEDN